VENLSKKYRISSQEDSMNCTTIREELTNSIKKPFQWLSGQKTGKEDVWALKNINFEVEQGEILGIIGPNGA
ncbi:unnamed protein product, partial [marine sediment metagenome]